LLPGTLQNVTNTKAKDAEAKDADGDWEFVEKLEKEEEDDFVVVPAGNIRKTKTYTSNLAEAGKGTGK
jgi:hypothetical protein